MSGKQSDVSLKSAAITIGVVLFLVIVSVVVLSLRPIKDVDNFEECVDAGGSLMESYPEQCRYNGKTYTNRAQQLPDKDISSIRDETIDYTGMLEDDALTDASNNDIPARVVERDGEPLPVTMDFIEGRHNFYVRDDLVYKVEIEGEAKDDQTSLEPGTDD